MPPAEEAVTDIAGGVSHEHLTIKMSALAPTTRQKEILLHEVLHAIFNTTSDRRKRWEEEDVVEMLDAPLLQILRENSAFVEWLTE